MYNYKEVDVLESCLIKDYKIAAKIVGLYGDKYIQGFQMIHDEITKIQTSKKSIALALKIANDEMD